MNGQLDLLVEAGKARNQAMRRVEAGMDDWTRNLIDQAIIARIQELGQASMNDCRDLLPEIGDRSKIGARVRALATSKRIVWVGSVPSTAPGTNAHRIGVYRLPAVTCWTDKAPQQ